MASPKKGPAAGSPVEKTLTDMDVASFLEAFRARPLPEQQRSPIWQELASFPQWASDQFITEGVSAAERAKALKPIPRSAREAPPDPRLPASERARILKDQQGDRPQVRETPDGRAITTKSSPHGGSNPWADYKAPPGSPDDFAFMGVHTDVRPPFPGKWDRIEGGWVRRGKETEQKV